MMKIFSLLIIVFMSNYYSCIAKSKLLPVDNLPELKEESIGGENIKYYFKYKMNKNRVAYFMQDNTVCVADDTHGIIATIINKYSRNTGSTKNQLFSNMKADLSSSKVVLNFNVHTYPFIGDGELKKVSSEKELVGVAKIVYSFTKSSIKYSIESVAKVKHSMVNVFNIKVNEIKKENKNFKEFQKKYKGSTIQFKKLRGKSFSLNVGDDSHIFKEKRKSSKNGDAGYKEIQINKRLGCTSITHEKPSSNGHFLVSNPSSAYMCYKALNASLAQNHKSQERFFIKSKKGKLGIYRLKTNKKNLLSGVLSFK